MASSYHLHATVSWRLENDEVLDDGRPSVHDSYAENRLATISESSEITPRAAPVADAHGKLTGPHKSSRPNYNLPSKFQPTRPGTTFRAATPCRELKRRRP
jgi:hypothetical protein